MRRIFTPEAEDEISEAAEWYEERRKGLGRDFIEETDRVFSRIEENPRLYQIVHLDIRRAKLQRFPYSIYYVLTEDIIGILAVHHNSREPRRWQWRRRSFP